MAADTDNSDSLFYLNEDPSLGKEVIASRDLEPGTLIQSESPTLRIPSWPNDLTFESQATCLTCGTLLRLDESSFKCSLCTWPLCSELCQTNPIHGTNECPLFTSTSFTFPPPSSTFTPKRIDWLIGAIRTGFLKVRSPALFQGLMSLQHIPRLPPTKVVLEMMEDVVETVLQSPPLQKLDLSKEEMVRLMWTVKLNGFACSSSDQEERQGRSCTMDCIFVDTSRINNSCSPNCSYFTNNQPPFKIVVRTAVRILKGQPLTINYFPYGCLPTNQRQRLIRSRYWFTCQCQRCQDPTENFTFMEAITCSPCQSEIRKSCVGGEDNSNLGYFIPVVIATDPLDESENEDDHSRRKMRCNRCGREKLSSTFSSLVKSLRNLVNELRPESVRDGYYSVHSQDAGFLMDFVRKHVNQEGRGQLHRNHWIVQLAAQKLADFIVSSESFEMGEVMRNYKKLCVYLLGIQEKIFPGRSLMTASLQLDLCSALFENLMIINNNDPDRSDTEDSEERLENMYLCLETLDKALPVFKSFEEDQESGYYKICSEFLTTVKKSVKEELINVATLK